MVNLACRLNNMGTTRGLHTRVFAFVGANIEFWNSFASSPSSCMRRICGLESGSISEGSLEGAAAPVCMHCIFPGGIGAAAACVVVCGPVLAASRFFLESGLRAGGIESFETLERGVRVTSHSPHKLRDSKRVQPPLETQTA